MTELRDEALGLVGLVPSVTVWRFSQAKIRKLVIKQIRTFCKQQSVEISIFLIKLQDSTKSANFLTQLDFKIRYKAGVQAVLLYGTKM